jgi:thioredoxin-like negative regulator of GroEL
MKYFARNIPQIVILDSKGRPVFNYIGESPESTLESWLNAALDYPNRLAEMDQPMDHPGETYTNDITHNPFTILKDHLSR